MIAPHDPTSDPRENMTRDESASLSSSREPAARASSEVAPVEAGALAVESARLAADLRCEDVTVLDVRGISQVTDYVVIASGTSERQMRSVAREIAGLGRDLGHAAFHGVSEKASNWVVVDFVDVTVHLFEPATRAYYDLEHLWLDAREMEWKRSEDERPATSTGRFVAEAFEDVDPSDPG